MLRILVETTSTQSSSSESEDQEQNLAGGSPAPSLASIRSEHAKIRRHVSKTTILTSIFCLKLFAVLFAFIMLFKVIYQKYSDLNAKQSKEIPAGVSYESLISNR